MVSVRAPGCGFGLCVATLSLVLVQYRRSHGIFVNVGSNWGSLGHCPKNAPEVLRRRSTSGTSSDVALPVFPHRFSTKNQRASRIWNGGAAFVAGKREFVVGERAYMFRRVKEFGDFRQQSQPCRSGPAGPEIRRAKISPKTLPIYYRKFFIFLFF